MYFWNMNAVEILKKHQLSKTHCRVLVLEHLMKNRKAFTQSDIEKDLKPLCNRSTIYRILDKMVLKDIIVKVDSGDSFRFFFDESMLDKGKTAYVFFECNRCQRIIPLQPVDSLRLQVPDTFEVKSTNFIVRGLCDTCKKQMAEILY